MIRGTNADPGTLTPKPPFPYWFRFGGDLGELVIRALKNIPDLHPSRPTPLVIGPPLSPAD